MKREFLKAFEGLTDDIVNQILDENGKDIERTKKDYDKLKAELDAANTTIQTMTDDMQALKDSNAAAEDWKKKFDDMQADIKAKEEQAGKELADKELTDSITSVFGNKVFTSDYVRNGIIADMKAEISKAENKGKGYAEIFDALTKDKEGIFASKNPAVQMSGIKAGASGAEITKEQFDRMGYSQKLEIFNKSPEVYNKLKGE